MSIKPLQKHLYWAIFSLKAASRQRVSEQQLDRSWLAKFFVEWTDHFFSSTPKLPVLFGLDSTNHLETICWGPPGSLCTGTHEHDPSSTSSSYEVLDATARFYQAAQEGLFCEVADRLLFSRVVWGCGFPFGVQSWKPSFATRNRGQKSTQNYNMHGIPGPPKVSRGSEYVTKQMQGVFDVEMSMNMVVMSLYWKHSGHSRANIFWMT